MLLPWHREDGSSSLQLCKLPLLKGPRDGCSQFLSLDRLDKIIHNALPEKGRRHIGIREAGQHDKWDARILASEIGDGVGSIDFWHTSVSDDGIE